MLVDNDEHSLLNIAHEVNMIVNVGDVVQARLGIGTVVKTDYDNEKSLIDTGKLIFWIHNRNLEILRRFYEDATNANSLLLCY